MSGTDYAVSACKTAPYQRGCCVLVEEMPDTRWPVDAKLDGEPKTFTGVFRAHGIDIRGLVGPGKLPGINPLVDDEAFRRINQAGFPGVPEGTWRTRMVVGLTGETPPGRKVLGVMRDDAAPYREAAVGFYRETVPATLTVDLEKLVPALRERPLGETPLAFLRTLLHEAGHVFGLQHGADVVGVGAGRTIMDPTAQVVGLITDPERPYPLGAEFGFSDHDATMLAHAPDVQVAPGRVQYNWLPGLIHKGVLPWGEASRWRFRFERGPEATAQAERPEQI